MTHRDEVADGGFPVRHHRFANVDKWLGAVITGAVACLLVFTSGYLVGSGRGDSRPVAGTPPQPQPASQSQNQIQNRNRDLPAPPGKSGSRPEAEHTTKRVTVEAGQSLWQIAAAVAPGKESAAIVAKIVRLNSLDAPDSIEVGQRLIVPVLHRDRDVAPVTAKVNGRFTSSESVAIPTRLDIPTLGLSRRLVNLDVVGGALQVPVHWNDVGWWQGGPRPGAPGSAVLVGHVDSPTGPAIFYELSSLDVGDLIKVERADSTVVTFQVVTSVLYPRSEFPSSKVYREEGPTLLNLVTCGGSYDREAGHYDGNLVVSARLMKKAKG
ncbi:MAG: sortase [Nocardioidaceae bacterium]|nr:sortase [Nocardioidaceae bacterium]